MPKKLKNLEITNVDFVDEGANQKANIKITKSRKSAISKAFSALGKAIGIREIPESIEKAATSFNDEINGNSVDQICNEIWDLTDALRQSLISIARDDDAENKTELYNQSLEQFSEAMKQIIPSWGSDTSAGVVKSTAYGKASKPQIAKKGAPQKGDIEEMAKIDKSKMSADDLNTYNAIIAKYAVNEHENPEGVGKANVDPDKNKETAEEKGGEEENEKTTKKSIHETENGEADIYKGIDPRIKAEIEGLKKFKAEAETRELNAVAKKYEAIGKKAEDLVPQLKKAKDAGMYDEMISLLDGQLAMQRQSGLFTEVGKSNHGSSKVTKNDINTKVETIAKGYMEKDPSISHTSAIAKAWNNNPDLFKEYDEQYNQ